MEKVCPVCAGSGKANEKYSREVHFGDGVYEHKCWLCQGVGKIMETPATHRPHVKKYWNCGGDRDEQYTCE
jgi:DnaJ-class molecular chaperone